MDSNIVEGTGVPNQKPVHGTNGKEGIDWVKVVLFAIFLLGCVVLIVFASGNLSLTSLTVLQKDYNDLNVVKLQSDFNSCLNYLNYAVARTNYCEGTLNQINDFNFPYLTINLPLKLNTFKGIIIKDSNKTLLLDLNTLTNLTKQYGVKE